MFASHIGPQRPSARNRQNGDPQQVQRVGAAGSAKPEIVHRDGVRGATPSCHRGNQRPSALSVAPWSARPLRIF